MNSQTSTKQTKARPNKKTTESAENFSAIKRNQNIHNAFPPFRLLYVVQFRESRLGCPLNARVISAKEQGTMSKNNLRGITLAYIS